MAGENPDFLLQDLFDAIESGNYPVRDVYAQVMDPKDAENYSVNLRTCGIDAENGSLVQPNPSSLPFRPVERL